MKRLVEFPSESGEPIMVEVDEALHKKWGLDTRSGRLLLNKSPRLAVACKFGARPVDEADHGYLAERKLKARRAVEDIGRVHREISATHGLHLE